MYQWDRINLGVCYYPEHWPQDLWESDLARMKEAGIGTIRIAEFAWSKFEPEEGIFTFDFFDRFLEAVQKAQMKVIFGTPTATPPAWLTARYPEVLNVNRAGVPYYHGARRHYNYNSVRYQELSARIVEKLAAHYGKHPAIIGWQIDNELNCEENEFHAESDSQAFRKFLRESYGTLTALNEAWGSVFWNQSYTDWEQIYVPRNTIHDTINPHQQLDYIRFISDSAIRFCRMQADILRQYIAPDVFITTNGMFENLDNHRMTRQCLDVYTYDSYPNFAYGLNENPGQAVDLRDRKWSRNLAEVRSICPHFGIMEQQSGANGWNCRMEMPAPKPGQMMLWTMQSIAHGADYVSFFRWRTSPVGTEIYWHGILNYDNRDNRKLAEVKQIHKRVEKLADMAGADYVPAFAVIEDYTNRWDEKADVWHGRLGWYSLQGLFRAGQKLHAPMDYLYLPEPDMRNRHTAEEEGKQEFLRQICRYRVVFYPHAAILTEDNAALLLEYVKQGGTLVLGCRTGYKDGNGRCRMTDLPGLLREAAGVTVTDGTLVGPADGANAVVLGGDAERIPAEVYCDILEPDADTKVLGTYENDYYAGTPAWTEHSYGKGRVLYFASAFSEQAAAGILRRLGIAEPWSDLITLPEECELAVRQKDGRKWIIVLNYERTAQTIYLHQAFTDADSGETAEGEIRLAPFETKVYLI